VPDQGRGAARINIYKRDGINRNTAARIDCYPSARKSSRKLSAPVQSSTPGGAPKLGNRKLGAKGISRLEGYSSSVVVGDNCRSFTNCGKRGVEGQRRSRGCVTWFARLLQTKSRRLFLGCRADSDRPSLAKEVGAVRDQG
jgi:hypothetical protein